MALNFKVSTLLVFLLLSANAIASGQEGLQVLELRSNLEQMHLEYYSLLDKRDALEQKIGQLSGNEAKKLQDQKKSLDSKIIKTSDSMKKISEKIRAINS